MFTFCTMMYVLCLLYRLEGRRAADVQREDGWLNVSRPLLGLSEETAEKAGQRNGLKTKVLKLSSVTLQLSAYKTT